MMTNRPPDLSRAIAGITAPDTRVAKEALELAWEASTPMLLNHVLRSFYLGQLLFQGAGSRDDEVVFLSTTLHDLGLTDHARGPRRFEIEGADAAKNFLNAREFDSQRTWLVWDTIALHTWSDINLYKQPEAKVAQMGIMADVVGAGLDQADRALVDEIVRAFPRHDFNNGFFGLLLDEAKNKPQTHAIHPVHMAAEHCFHHVPIPDARALIQASPFDE